MRKHRIVGNMKHQLTACVGGARQGSSFIKLLRTRAIRSEGKCSTLQRVQSCTIHLFDHQLAAGDRHGAIIGVESQFLLLFIRVQRNGVAEHRLIAVVCNDAVVLQQQRGVIRNRHVQPFITFRFQIGILARRDWLHLGDRLAMIVVIQFYIAAVEACTAVSIHSHNVFQIQRFSVAQNHTLRVDNDRIGNAVAPLAVAVLLLAGFGKRFNLARDRGGSGRGFFVPAGPPAGGVLVFPFCREQVVPPRVRIKGNTVKILDLVLFAGHKFTHRNGYRVICRIIA